MLHERRLNVEEILRHQGGAGRHVETHRRVEMRPEAQAIKQGLEKLGLCGSIATARYWCRCG
jgi:hypothetical protein